MKFKRSLGIVLSILIAAMPVVPVSAKTDTLICDVTSNDRFDLKKEVSKNTYSKDEDFEIKYTVTPKDIPAESSSVNGEVIFIIDTSNSMKYNVINRLVRAGGQLKIKNDDNSILEIPDYARIDIVKKSLNSFIKNNNLYGKSSVFTFNMYGQPIRINSKDDIDSINVSQASNLGDGLRVAYDYYRKDLSNKTFIVLTDGKPNIRSYYITSKNKKAIRPDFIGQDGIYLEKSGYESAFNKEGLPWYGKHSNEYSAIDIPEDGKTSGGFEDGNLNFDDSIDMSKISDEKEKFTSKDINTQNYSRDNLGIGYANEIIKLIASNSTYKNNFNCYMVGITKDQTGIDNLKNICTREDGKKYGEVLQAVSNEELTSVLNNIYGDSPVKSTSFEEIFPKGIEVISTSLPSLKIHKNEVSGDLSNISYTYDRVKKVYHAEPVSFTVKVKGNNISSYNISTNSDGKNTSFFRYKDMHLKNADAYLNFPVLNVNIEKSFLMDIKRDCSVTGAQKGDTFDVTYIIIPKPIRVENNTGNPNKNKQKDVVFVIDTSGSMKYVPESDRKPYWGEKSRLDIMKEVAQNFISNFEDKGKAKIALIEYASESNLLDDITNVNSNNIESVKKHINSLQAGGSTNTGDGLRIAYSIFPNAQGHEKYIVLMTDGEPEACGVDWYGRYYMKSSGKPYYVYESGSYIYYGRKIYNPDYREESLGYAKKVTKKLIAPNNIKTFVIGFGNGASSKNKEIANAANGTYISAQDEDAINSVFSGIKNIIDTNIDGTANFEEIISNNLEVVDSDNLPLGLKVSGNKIVGDIKNIHYKLSDDKKTYNAAPVQFTVKYRAKDDGDYIFGKGGSSYVKLNVLNNTESKSFDTLIVPDVSKNTSAKVTIDVKDASGTVDSYSTSAQKDNNLQYNKFLDESIHLKGESYANIKFEGQSNFFQYQFLNRTSNPTNFPSSGWIDMDVQKQEVNEDVITDKNGYLNWRGYDVNHMPTRSNETAWNNPELVFQNPYAATAFKTAKYSSNSKKYGRWEKTVPQTIKNIYDENVYVDKRWSSNSVFMNNMNITWDEGSNNTDYKEASKFWGYIKVPQDGEYIFGAYSDDGCRGYITQEGETSAFVDMFKVQSTSFGTTNKKYVLKADRYYPIYLEYFNWGGWADFRMQYLNSRNKWDNVPTEWFYPSKDMTPGEYTKTIFTGAQGIKFPSAPGKYYIAFRTGIKDSEGNISEIKKGIYGSFIVEPKVDFLLTRYLSNDDKPKQGEEFELKYKIQLADIKVKELYPEIKDGDALDNESKITVKDVKFEDVFPEGVVPSSKNNSTNAIVNGQKINGTLSVDGIQYELVNSTNKLTEAVYKAQPIEFSVWLRLNENGEKQYKFEGKNSIITYEDIDGAKRQANFPDFILNSKSDNNILKHGLFLRNNSQNDYVAEGVNGNIDVAYGMPIILAMIADIKTPNAVISLELDNNYEKGNIVFNKYEIINGEIVRESLQTSNLNSNTLNIVSSEDFLLESGKKYLITYSITPVGKEKDVINIASEIDHKDSSKKSLKLNIKDKPNLY